MEQCTDSAMDDSEDEGDQEYDEAVIYVEFAGLGVTDILKQTNPDLKIIGLVEGEPILQLGGQVYSGTLDDVSGTHLFFETRTLPAEDQDPVLEPGKDQWSQLVCGTSKELVVRRIFTKKKGTTADGQEGEGEEGQEGEGGEEGLEEQEGDAEQEGADTSGQSNIVEPAVLVEYLED